MARGTNTRSRPAIHAPDFTISPANESMGWCVTGSRMATFPMARYLARLHQYVTGLFRATTCNADAIPATGTNAELTNTTGKIHVNEAAWTASTSFKARPRHAEIHENANPTARTSAISPNALSGPCMN